MFKTTSNFLLFLFCLLTANLFSQEYLYDGEVRTYDGKVLKGKILAENWQENPKSIGFTAEGGSAKTLSLGQFESFSVTRPDGRQEKYRSRMVAYDESSQELARLDNQQQPLLKTDSLLLLVLVESELSLMLFTDTRGREHFYLEKKGVAPEYLLYREYLIDGRAGTKRVANKAYLYTLDQHFQDCPAMTGNSTDYNQKDLTNSVKDYLTCSGKNTTFEYKKMKKELRFWLYTGVNANFASITSTENNEPNEFTPGDLGTSVKPLFGIALARKFNKTKRPTYLHTELMLRQFEYDWTYSEIITGGAQLIFDGNLKSLCIDISPVVKHSLSNGSIQPYIVAGPTISLMGFDFDMTKRTVTSTGEWEDDITFYPGLRGSQFGLTGGMGLRYKRLTGELRYRWGTGFTDSTSKTSSDQSVMFVLGFCL
ncbi:MAG: outer membrane beta-barrel protein [Saprospiraceae bacterium]|nr:outer membrane beta-barrel protein [Saprospiraceae bacterium]